MNEATTSGGAASGPAGAGNFGQLERKRQAAFRKGLTTPTDPVGLRHDYLLALGCEEENLFPTLRGENGALRYFAERNIKWWQARVSGDASDGKRPTARVVVVVPEGNRAYRERVTSPTLAKAFPNRTVSGIVKETLVHPDRVYVSVSQSTLTTAARSRCEDETAAWGEYHRDRYGW